MKRVMFGQRIERGDDNVGESERLFRPEITHFHAVELIS